MKIKKNPNAILIGFCGDVMIGRLVNEHLNNVPSEYIWGNVLPLLKSTDFNIANLETALTVSEKEVPKVFNFKADPSKIQSLLDGGISAVSLANNHVLDYSKEGLFETLETLDNAGILHVGAGKNSQEAKQPVILEKLGIKIGILAYTDNEPTWIAKNDIPGTNYITIGDIEVVKNDIINIRKQVDVLVVSIHWGPNMRERPPQYFIQFAHQLIDSGVDIIHGHSAHIFQGVELYKNGLIMYDTGDFVDDYFVDPMLRNDRSFFFAVEVDKTGFQSLQLIPTLIGDFQVNLATEQDKSEAISRMKNYRKNSTPTFKKMN